MTEGTCTKCGGEASALFGGRVLVCLGCGNEPGSCKCDRVPGAVGQADPVLAALGLGDEDAEGYPAAPSAPDTEPGPNVVVLADVEAEHVDWLWSGYLPRRKVVVLDGDPGVGKSTVALDLAARITTGSPMPDGTEPVKGAVLILSAEDGLADTIRPRLDAADGDADQVITITEIAARGEDGERFARPVTLPGDLPHVEQVIRRHGVVLVVVDVLMAYLSGAVDSYRDQDVRRALHPLAAMADRTGCTVLVLRHFSKTGGEKAVYRGGGSIGIIGAARAAFMCGTDPEDDTGHRRVLAPVKCNLSAMPPSIAYQLVPDELRGCARVGWLGETPLTAAALLADRGTDDERGERDEAAKWLTDYLISQGGEAPWADIRKQARAAGIADRTLQRAHWRAGVIIRRAGFGRGSVWSLDPDTVHSRQPDGANGANGANDDGSPHSRQSRHQDPIENPGANGANEAWPEGTLGAEANTDEEGP